MYLLQKLQRNNKGFTLIELIVVMAVLAVLVLLATPNFIGRTKEAKMTKYLNNTKVLEDASERYYIDNGKWPRGDEAPYTPEELEDYADNIYAITGERVQLDEGNYWDIDYEALEPYVQLPEEDEREHYVIRNPVGKIYYLDEVNKERKQEIDKKKEVTGEVVDVAQYTNDGEEIVFQGLHASAYDGDKGTSQAGVGIVTWEGNLEDREIEIKGKGYSSGNTLEVRFLNNKGELIKPANSDTDSITVANGNIQTVRVVVPKGATQMEFFAKGLKYDERFMRIYEITVPETLERPLYTKSTLSSESSPSEITLHWTRVDRAIIWKNGRLLADVEGSSYTDKPLYSNSEHLYTVVLVDGNGNAQRASYKARTLTGVVAFRGLSPEAFDYDTTTSQAGLGVVTWEGNLGGREIEITGKGYSSSNSLEVEFLDKEGNILHPDNTTTDSLTVAGGDKGSLRITVPEGAESMRFFGKTLSYDERFMRIYDIRVVE